MTFKFINGSTTYYLNEFILEKLRNSILKLKHPFDKTNKCQKISVVYLVFWSNCYSQKIEEKQQL